MPTNGENERILLEKHGICVTAHVRVSLRHNCVRRIELAVTGALFIVP